MKTGKFQPAADESRPGVFICEPDAIVWAADLRDALRDGKPLISWVDRKRIEELAELLESVKRA